MYNGEIMNIPTNKSFENLTDQRFGRLIVLEYAGAKYPDKKTKGHQWLCRCDCGNKIITLGGNLKKGTTTSCGCYQKDKIHERFEDLSNRKFGKLTVLNYIDHRHGHSYWLCKCECGRSKEISGVSLKEGKTKSCGCRQKFGNFKHGLWGTPEYKRYRFQNPVIKLQHNVSCSVRDAIHERNGKKSGRTFDNLPYTVQQLKDHLEKQFESWMNWSNYGGRNDSKIKSWTIDHIIPQSKFPYKSLNDSLFQECWALSNLRPLEKIENIRKGNR